MNNERVYKYNNHSAAPVQKGDEFVTRDFAGRIVTHERVTQIIVDPNNVPRHFVTVVTRPRTVN